MYAGILIGFWTQVHGSVIATNLGGRIASAFISFAVLLGVLWFFGFGLGQALVRRLQSRTARIAFPGLLAIPYLVFSIPRGEFQTAYALGLAACPMVLAALFEFSDLRPELAWQDALALLAIALLLEMRVFSGAWPYNGLGGLPKLYLADVTLYSYLVVRRLEGVGYSFIPRARDFYTAIREWLFFFPLAMAIGFAVHFIQFYPRRPSLGHVADALLITFLLTAIPEELFFRGVLQNLLEPRMGKAAALILASCLFGLSHFHKVGSTTGAVSAGTLFNWRYVILAAIAGVFYGRAWRARRTLFASALTHTLVDVVWSLWFR
jgi:membrane protease YdiL (CAAX protease family)